MYHIEISHVARMHQNFEYICKKKSNIGTETIQVSFPQELGFALKMPEPELANEMRRLVIVKLY